MQCRPSGPPDTAALKGCITEVSFVRRRSHNVGVLLFTLLAAVGAASLRAVPVPLQAAQNRDATRADFDRLMKELSNWGRWGKDDQLGAVNLITPAKKKRALLAV